MTEYEIRSIAQEGEWQRVEYKASFAEEHEGINPLGAFANSEGGTLLFGVKDDGTIVGVQLGTRALENFANNLARDTDPTIHVTIDEATIDGLVVVSVAVRPPHLGELYFAFWRALIRVGKINQRMSAQEQKTRLLEGAQEQNALLVIGAPERSALRVSGERDWAEEINRPRFELPSRALTRTESQFQPQWRLKQVSGDIVSIVEWRYRWARLTPEMEWGQVNGSHLPRYTCTATFDLSQPTHLDPLVTEDQIGIEIRFHWHGQMRHELHRFDLMRASSSTKQMWDVGKEILPPIIDAGDS